MSQLQEALRDLTNLVDAGYTEPWMLEREIQYLATAVRLMAGWVQCPKCLRWHEPEPGLTLERCRCGYSFRTGIKGEQS